MIKDFFVDKFEYDFRSNKQWIEHLTNNEDQLSEYITKSMSHIINVHHIWIHRLINQGQESYTWDHLPLDYWTKLAHENYLKTIEYLEQIELNEKVNYHTEEGVLLSNTAIDILYHILNHSNYHRGQIAKELRDLGLDAPSFNFISYK
ncbi:MAG: DinB family protein [Crocinitomicaceae bacterium]|nr:DinB family protein [Crocinitomicaceae bacterium]